MENRERFVIEVFLGLILIVFLILLIFLVIRTSDGNETETSTEITNSYNTNYYNTYRQTRSRVYTTAKPTVKYITSRPYFADTNNYRDDHSSVYYVDSDSYRRYDDYLDYRYDDFYDEKKYMEFDDSSRLRKSKGFIGNNINNYEVYVRNEEFNSNFTA